MTREEYGTDGNIYQMSISNGKEYSSKDAVSREAVRQGMVKYGFHAPDMTVTEFVEDELPSVQPERLHGEWISREGNGQKLPFWGRYECSVCGECAENNNFCPNCGADMRGEQK